MKNPGNTGARQLLTFYYLASPLFLLGHGLFGWSIRVQFLEGGGWLWMYYGFCFAIGLAVRKWPRAGGLLGMLESSVNLLMLLLAVMVPVFRMGDAIENPDYTPPFSDPGAIPGFLVAGTALLVASGSTSARCVREWRGTDPAQQAALTIPGPWGMVCPEFLDGNRV